LKDSEIKFEKKRVRKEQISSTFASFRPSVLQELKMVLAVGQYHQLS
jgi:hypothetical protein